MKSVLISFFSWLREKHNKANVMEKEIEDDTTIRCLEEYEEQ